MSILITGGAGFIGHHLAKHLLETSSEELVLIDNLEVDYTETFYRDMMLKFTRLSRLGIDKGDLISGKTTIVNDRCVFHRMDITDRKNLEEVFQEHRISTVIHLAAKAGVRKSSECPEEYIASNLTGFFNVLDLSRIYGVSKFVYASSSSVYGDLQKERFSEDDMLDLPKSLYAATKRSDELLAQSYASMFSMPTIGLRFFSVYGEYGRPDLVVWKWVDGILNDTPVVMFGNGTMERDFTYVGDVVQGISKILGTEKHKGAHIYNLGCGKPVKISDLIHRIEDLCGKRAKIQMRPAHPSDVERTCADTTKFFAEYGYKPETTLEQGLERFVSWFRNYS